MDNQIVVHVEPAPVDLPTGWGARINATVTCGCGDPESGVPIPDVHLVATGWGEWRARDPLPCGCICVVPQQVQGPSHVTDVVILDPGEEP